MSSKGGSQIVTHLIGILETIKKLYYLHHRLYVIEGFNGVLYVFSFPLLSSCNILIIIIYQYIRLIAL